MAGRSQWALSNALLLVALTGATTMLAVRAFADEGASTKICLNFCDVDAKQCRADAKDLAQYEVSPLDPNDFSIHSHRLAPRDDFSNEKKLAALHAADDDRFAASQKCTVVRMACVQRCGAPVAPPPASAP